MKWHYLLYFALTVAMFWNLGKQFIELCKEERRMLDDIKNTEESQKVNID